MSKPDRYSPENQKQLRLMGNPYASLSAFPEHDAGEALAQGPSDSTIKDREHPEVQQHLRELGNQYASLSIFPGDDNSIQTPQHQLAQDALPNSSPVQPKTMSKADFRATCRRVFRPYIPEIEGGRLRQHHRDFIARNEVRSPTARAEIVAQLTKYDISREGLRPQFNREHEPFTDEKLRTIEKLVEDAK